MRSTLISALFFIMMIIFAGIISTSLALEKGKKKSKANPTIKALAHIACKGKAKCMAKKIKAAKCNFAKFSLKGAIGAVKAYKAAAAKKNIKAEVKAAKAFKIAMKAVANCNICPKTMRAAFKRGFKIVKGGKAKKAKKAAKKAVKKS